MDHYIVRSYINEFPHIKIHTIIWLLLFSYNEFAIQYKFLTIKESDDFLCHLINWNFISNFRFNFIFYVKNKNNIQL